jgi:AraC-like DNA-binding protein
MRLQRRSRFANLDESRFVFRRTEVSVAIDPLPIVSLSTAQFDPGVRVPAFEAAAASICKLAIKPEHPESYSSSTTIKILPGAVTARTNHSASITTRTRAMAADEADNLLIHIPLNHGFSMSQTGGLEVECKAGEIYLDPNEVPGRAAFHSARTDLFYVSLPRAALARHSGALNGRLRQTMKVSPQWRMFIRYAQSLDAEAAELSATERSISCAHLHELVQLAVNSENASRLEAQGRGVRAARLRAMQADIEMQLTKPGLTLAEIALGQGISERYARALFSEQETTFRDYVTHRRMQIVRRMLIDPAQDHRSISDLAMSSGFGDLSWFNKCYRQIFGETPSDSRAGGDKR